jgi:hypothetical protein
MLLSSSEPPWVSGTMWSGTVASQTRPLAAQSLHRGSAFKRSKRWVTALRPRRRAVRLPANMKLGVVPEVCVTADINGQPLPVAKFLQMGPISLIDLH